MEVADLNKGQYIKADLCSRPNAMNGKYRVCNLGLENLAEVKDSDVFFLETLQMKANLADKMFVEAESQGKDMTDIKILRALGEEINAIGTPIHLNQSIMTAVFVSLQLIAYYGIAIGIWGLVFKNSFWVFALYGAIIGLLISLLSAAPVIAFQRTRQKIRNMVDGASLLWGTLGIIIGVVGILALVIRLIFFN